LVSGVVRPPGDKSISHRVLMLAALAKGKSELSGLLTGDDVKSSARVLRQLGVDVSSIREGVVTVRGKRLTPHAARLHCGNSGTTARLMLGILAGQRFAATLTGDASLRRRPMRRVTEPLKQMGADIKEKGDGLPLTIRGGKLRAQLQQPRCQRAGQERAPLCRSHGAGTGNYSGAVSLARSHRTSTGAPGTGNS